MKRQDYEPPFAIFRWGWCYHHTGISTQERRDGECYLPQFKMYVSGFPDSPYGVEWMRFEADSPISELIKTIPHIAFEVDDIDEAFKVKKVLSAPGSPSAEVRAAMIIDNGCPIELIEFTRIDWIEISCMPSNKLIKLTKPRGGAAPHRSFAAYPPALDGENK